MDQKVDRQELEGRLEPQLRSPARLLKILQILAQSPEGRHLSGISLALGAPKTSTFSLIKALCHEGYVRMKGSTYFLDDAAFALATMINAAQRGTVDLDELPDLAAPFIRQLAERSGETVFISTLTDDRQEAVYIARAESRHPIRFMAQIGERRPLYSSSGGRALLAYMPEPEQQAYLKAFKPRKTARESIIDRKALAAMIAETRRRRIATTSNDTHVGVSAWATPIFSRHGDAVAALIIAAPSERSEPKGGLIIEQLLSSARELSLVMGCKAPPAS